VITPAQPAPDRELALIERIIAAEAAITSSGAPAPAADRSARASIRERAIAVLDAALWPASNTPTDPLDRKILPGHTQRAR